MDDKVFSIVGQNNSIFQPKRKIEHLLFLVALQYEARGNHLKWHEKCHERSSKFCFTSINVLCWLFGSLFGTSIDLTLSFLLL